MARHLTLVALLAVALAGCSRISFVSQRMDNFSAYYNTFYNAEKALEEGVDRFREAREREPINRDVYLELFGRGDRGTTQRQPFEDAIQKSADILREHPDSKWVDDAMLVIGQAWFFTQNYVGAQKKFEEILGIESELHDEARFWLGRTLIGSGQFDAAFTFLQATLEREDLAERWEPMLRLALADLHVQRKSWEQAAEALEFGLEAARDQDLASRAQFLLGQVYETLESWEEAVVVYDDVQDYKPFFQLSYAAQFNATRALSDHVDPEAALARLRRMDRDDKNYEYRGELAYLRGRILAELEAWDDALDTFDELLYDPTADGSKVRGHVHYSLGEYFRDIEQDFTYAAAYFDTANRNLPSIRRMTGLSAGRAPSFAPGAITDGAEQARVFQGFADARDRILHLDSLLYLGSLDDSTFNAFVLELREKIAEEMEEQRKVDARRRAEAGFQGGGGGSYGGSSGRTPDGKDIGSGRDAGFLFHRDQVRKQQAAADFQIEWGDRPLAPNWRRKHAIQSIGAEDEFGGERLADETEEAGAVLPEVDVSDVPRDERSREIVLGDRASARYELANVLFLSMHMPDSAAGWYRMVIEEDGTRQVAQRAYYALAEVQRALGDDVGAERLYRTIIDRYPISDFSGQVYERLGLEPEFEPPPDSLTMAEAAYDAALADWKEGAFASSLNEMVEIALGFPNTPVAPRALMAAGNIYMEWAVRDSLDLFELLPLGIPDSVLYSTDLFMEVLQPAFAPRVYDAVVKPIEDRPEPEPEEAEPILPRLETLYERLLVLYPTNAQAGMAQAMQGALGEHRDFLANVADSLARVDSLATLARDSLLLAQSDSLRSVLADTSLAASMDSLAHAAGDSLAFVAPDSLVAVRGDSLAANSALVAASAEPPRVERPGMGLIDWSAGGFTVLVRTLADHGEAIDFARYVQPMLTEQTHSLDVYAADVRDGQEFRVGLGLFATRQQAETVLEANARFLPPDARVRRVPKSEEANESEAAVAAEPADEPESRAVRRSGLVSFGPAMEPEEPKDPGLGLVDWSQGGFTVYLRTDHSHDSAVGFARNYGAALPGLEHPLDVYTAVEDGEQVFRIGIGLFETMQEAESVLERFKAMLPQGSRVQRIPKKQTDR